MARNFQNMLGEAAALSQMSQLGGLLAASQLQQQTVPTWGQGTPIATMQTGLALGPNVPQMHYGAPQNFTHMMSPRADATPPAAQKHEEVFKRLETIIDKAHNAAGGSEVTKKADMSPQASTTDQEEFDKMLGKSQLVGQLQTDVGKVQTQVCTINTSMNGIKTEQKSGFGRLEALMMNFTPSPSTKLGPKPDLSDTIRSPASSISAETPSPPSSPAPTLIDSNVDENMVSSTTHDELVRLLELNSASSVVVRARPKEDTCVSLARWINKILSSKRVCNWQETLISIGHEESIVKSLDDIDGIFDFLLGHIQSNTRDAKMSLTGS